MTTINADLRKTVVPPIPDELTQENYQAIVARLTWQSPMYANDTSFPGELNRLQAKGIDGYLFTAYSAVPLADAVLAFYETLGLESPWIGYVDTRLVSVIGASAKEALKQQEAQRLAPSVSSLGSLCIVEQYINKGYSLLFAHDCVREATDGAILQDDIRGSYYHNAINDEIDLTTMTSVHAEFMREVGKRAALGTLLPAQ